MKLLIIGGTAFLGRALTEAALAKGHEVTLFNRGQTNPDLFPKVEKLHGDRNQDLSPLKGRRWDAVIDTCGYTPRAVRAVTELLADKIDHYTFISSISVYADPSRPGIREDWDVLKLEDETNEEVAQNYGALKALSERTAESVLPGRTLVLRAGLLVGPHDYVNRFPYWVRRIAEGGEVLAPGNPDRQVQVIDVRDLALWNLRLAESRRAGVFNATGPEHRLTMGRLLLACKVATNSDATFTWVSEDFLLAEEVGPWDELPLWLPETGESSGMLAANVEKAFRSGIAYRPVVETARDTWAWLNTPADGSAPVKRPIEIRSGLAREKETELLRKWHRRQQ